MSPGTSLFANIFSALLIWMKRNRIFMSWTLPSACNPCGGFFWSILPTNPRLPGENSLEYDRIKKILSYIEENYQNKITLNDIAGHIHLCESECTRLFKRHMNTTLFAFLQEYRIERSLEFCRMTSLSARWLTRLDFQTPIIIPKFLPK